MSGISGCSFSCLSWRSRLKWEYRGSESYKCGGILEGLDDHGVAQSQSVRRATSARLTVSPMQRLQRAGAGAVPVGASELKIPKFRAGPSYLPGLWNRAG